jgi:hypothetical protein
MWTIASANSDHKRLCSPARAAGERVVARYPRIARSWVGLTIVAYLPCIRAPSRCSLATHTRRVLKRKNNRSIGIGRSLATPPSHTTRHTGPYHGGSIWSHAVRCIQSDEAHLIKEAVGQCYLYPWGMADSPWTFATPRGNVRQEWVDPPLDQFRLPSPVHLPVFPLEASETMAYPAVHIPQHHGRLAEAKVALPSLQILIPRRDDVLQATVVSLDSVDEKATT